MKKLAQSNNRAKKLAQSNDRAAWLINGNIYLAPIDAQMDVDGYPMGARWECSEKHWEIYQDVFTMRGFIAIETDDFMK